MFAEYGRIALEGDKSRGNSRENTPVKSMISEKEKYEEVDEKKASTNTNTIGDSGTQLATNHTFASNVDGWYGDSSCTVTHSTDNGQDGQSGIARVTRNGGADYTYAIKQNDVFTPEDRIGPTFIGGARYRVKFDIKPTFTGSYTLRVRAGGNATQWSITSGLTSGSWSSHDTGIIIADGTPLEIGSLGGTINSFDIDNNQPVDPHNMCCFDKYHHQYSMHHHLPQIRQNHHYQQLVLLMGQSI